MDVASSNPLIIRASSNRSLPTSSSNGTNTPLTRQALKASSVETSRTFAPNASIVLIGIRGCGKTSLGYIAARALGWRLIEADDEFERITGRSRAQFLKECQNNADEYRLQERQVMESMLVNNPTDAVIVCGVGSIESHGQSLLRTYSLHHPVIHVIRETELVRDWLRIPKDSDLIQRLEGSDRKHRLCSNFEYYNVFDGGSQKAYTSVRTSRGEASGQRSPRYEGTLQRAQQDFIRFINLIMGFTDLSLQELNSKVSAAAVSPDNRAYTYALSVEFTHLAAGEVDTMELECGADAIELVVNASDMVDHSLTVDSDWISKLSKQFALLRRKIAAPIIFHVNKSSLQSLPGIAMSSDEIYFELLHLGVRMGAEFVTVDLDFNEFWMLPFFRAKGTTKIIGDSFDKEQSSKSWDDSELMAKYQRAVRLRCDIVRMTQFAVSDEDNISIRHFRNLIFEQDPKIRLPLIAYNVGRLGRASMCSNTILTSVTLPSFREHKKLDPAALLTMQEASRMTYDLGMLDPLHFCIIGASVLYSLSPAMHNAGYSACGLPHTYKIRQSSSLKELESLFKDPTFGGAAISLPFKIKILKDLRSLSPEALAIGAVNTIVLVNHSSKSFSSANNRRLQTSGTHTIEWHGHNTDWIGITTCVRRNLSPANMIRYQTTSLVIGAGGMARAAVYALIRLDVPNIFILNRTIGNAERLAAHFNNFAATYQSAASPSDRRKVNYRINVLKSMEEPWPADYEQPTIVISCVPAHSIEGAPPANITLPLSWLQSVNGGVIIELAYKPLVTPLLEQIQQLRKSGRPWVPVNGLEVLPEQGIAQFQLMTGRIAPRHIMRNEVLSKYIGEEGQYMETSNKI